VRNPEIMRKYQLRINGEKVDVALDIKADNTGDILSLNDNKYQISFTSLGGHAWFIECDKHNYQAYITRNEDGSHIFVDGQVYLIEDLSKTKSARSRTGNPGQGPDVVTPPTPAVVERIMVKDGQTVDKGQALVTVSAMKMEMTLTAPYAGVIASINTMEGAQVAPGDILVDITAHTSKTSQ